MSTISMARSILPIVLCCCAAGCVQKPATPPAALKLPGMDRVHVTRNLHYVEESSDKLLDVYSPSQPPSNGISPAVILIHGTAKAQDRFKDSAAFQSWGRLLAASGVAAVTFNWDWGRETDVNAAIAYVRTNAHKLGIDKDKLCLFAFSGGASESLHAGLDGRPPHIACIVAYYGHLASALNYLRPPVTRRSSASSNPDRLPPILVAKGQLDDIVPAKDIDDFVTEARTLGADVNLLTHETGGHAFDLTDNDRSREIIRDTIGFIRSHLMPRPPHPSNHPPQHAP